MLNIDGEFMGLAVKTLLVVLVVTVLLSAVVFYYRETYQKEWQGVERSGFTNFESQSGTTKPQYVLWIGDVLTTLDVLDLAQRSNTVIQPIYIPDPTHSSARTEYELQITRTLRAMINTKYTQSKLLPIISIIKDRPDDDAFNREYDMSMKDDTSDALTRENILRRWAKYYKLTIEHPSTTRATTQGGPGKKQTSMVQSKKKTSNARILSETWNCRFPIGTSSTNGSVPCGLCKKCEKLNSL